MKYGVEFPNTGIYSDTRLLAELAHLAEASGWDGFFVWDTLYYDAREKAVSDPWIALAAVALQTQRINIGLTVASLTRRRPWKVAREAVTLDQLSNGRLILGVGAGYVEDQGFAAFGEETDAKKRASKFDESLAILQGLWSGQPFSFQGEHYHVDDVTFLPTPVQTPRIPIWVASFWPKKKPTERAARWDGILPAKLNKDGNMEAMTPADIEQLKRSMDERRPAGAPFDIVAGGPVFEAAHDEQARTHLRALASAGATWLMQAAWSEDLDSIRASIKKGPPSL